MAYLIRRNRIGGARWLALGLLCIGAWSSVAVAAGPARKWDGLIVDARSGATLSRETLLLTLKNVNLVALGEKHDTPAIQAAQATLMRDLVHYRGMPGRFLLAWELLDYSRQSQHQVAFARFKRGEITARQFLNEVQSPRPRDSYVPLLETLRDEDGALWGVNLSPEESAPVEQGGLAGADPKLVPEGFALGSDRYRQRFQQVSSGSSDPGTIARRFELQSLTDDVMAHHLAAQSEYWLTFLIIDGFRTDYFDGTVARLRARMPAREVRTIRFIDAAEFRRDDLEVRLPGLLQDAEYGLLADVVIFSSEPQ